MRDSLCLKRGGRGGGNRGFEEEARGIVGCLSWCMKAGVGKKKGVREK